MGERLNSISMYVFSCEYFKFFFFRFFSVDMIQKSIQLFLIHLLQLLFVLATLCYQLQLNDGPRHTNSSVRIEMLDLMENSSKSLTVCSFQSLSKFQHRNVYQI